MIRIAALIIGMILSVPMSARAVQPSPLPGDSVYQLDLALVDQDARSFRLADLRGKPRLLTMFYASCPYMCPLIIDTLRLTERELDARQRDALGVLMVSFDTARDDPAALKALAGKRRIDTGRWSLARADAAGVRKFAAILGIQYRALDDGEFSHSSVLILLDAEGRIAARSETMGKIDPAFVARIREVLGKP
ncbi:SCO family protein [Dokdonella sp.]|uniref:SCO family protein n=2 Tax=Dokdonella sp. TaxID=2291710 RepID=UPI002B68B971|nr:SCO family protein [Dokdonella sp.]HOX72877.1 SCO family protein [Dokdonella sp.]HPN80160.1 SCO family protein [Dokdonella sp.]